MVISADTRDDAVGFRCVLAAVPKAPPEFKPTAQESIVPAGAKLNDAQIKAFKEGGLYVNVHTAANKGGEVRGQLNP